MAITSFAARQPRAHRNGQTHFDLLAKYIADDRRGRDAAGVLRTASDPASELRVSSQQHPLLDERSPPFTLLDSDAKPWNLDEKLERGPVVLVFYLNYGCDACVTGLFELNADFRSFQALGVEVAAISDDPADLTQRRFKRYGEFSFPVLSDPGHTVAAAYSIFHLANADKPEELLHGTFVISQDRRVKWVQTGAAPFTPNTALLCELARLDPESSVAALERAAKTKTEDR